MLNRCDARTYPRPRLDPDPADQDDAMAAGVLVDGQHNFSPREVVKVHRPAPVYIGEIGMEPQRLLLNQACTLLRD